MSKKAARLLAAGLAVAGLVFLLLVVPRLDAAGVFMLGVGAGCLVAATWINTTTATGNEPNA